MMLLKKFLNDEIKKVKKLSCDGTKRWYFLVPSAVMVLKRLQNIRISFVKF